MKVNIGPYSKGEEERVVDVHIDPYDTWNLDHTLALIIHPALKQLKEEKMGYPIMEVEDIPERFDVSFSDHENIYKGTDDSEESSKKYERAWDWALDEMIWAFEYVIKDEKYNEAKDARAKKALILFGKYYMAMWD